MTDEILKLKILRDFKKFKKNKNKYPIKYLKLLELIDNIWFSSIIYTSNFTQAFSQNKLHLSDLNKMDLKLLKEICYLDNIIIIKQPRFNIYYIEKYNLLSKNMQTVDWYPPSSSEIIEYINNNKNYIYYIYIIKNNLIRFYKHKNDRWLNILRKEKIQAITI